VGAVIANPSLTVALNTFFLACEVCSVFYHDIWGIHRAIVVYAFVCIFAWAQDRSFTSEVEAKLAAKVAKEGETRVHDILSHVCDAVLELDETFTISTESLNFGAIVLQGGSCRGRCFIDFILCEDRPALLQFLRSNSEGNVRSCSSRLVIPSSSSMAAVTVWHSCSRGMNGLSRHLIGVQEDQQDVCRAPLMPLRESPWQQNQSKNKSRKGSDHKRGTALLQRLSPDALNFGADTVAVKVATEDPELPIIELTVGAQLLFGPSVGIGSALVKFVPQQDPFVEWIQAVMNYYFNGHLDKAAQQNRTVVTLLVHTSCTPETFTCTLALSDADSDDAATPVFLVFSPASKSNSSGSSGSSSAELTGGRNTRRGRCSSSDSNQPCSGSLAHGTSATSQQVESI